MAEPVKVVIAYSNNTAEIGTIRELPREKAQAWCADGRARRATEDEIKAAEEADDAESAKVAGPTAPPEDGDVLAGRGSVTRTDETRAATSSSDPAVAASSGAVDATDSSGAQAGTDTSSTTTETATDGESGSTDTASTDTAPPNASNSGSGTGSRSGRRNS